MKIIALEAENVKHLRVVNIKPDGSLVVVGGDNEAGKTCVLDSIEYALNGASSIPSKPIRVGQKKARVVLDLGDIQVTRTFTAKGTNLTVKNKEGATFASPQAMLDKLVGELTFDPLEFSKMDAKKQAAVLKQLVGLNFDKADADYKELFAKRTLVHRRGTEVKAHFSSMTKHDGMPDEEISASGLSDKYAAALVHNQKIDISNQKLKHEIDELESLEKQVKKLKSDIKKRQKAIQDSGVMIDSEAIHKQIADAESVNTKIRENKTYQANHVELTELRKQSGLLNKRMSKIMDTRSKALSEAKFPIKGLAVNDDVVTFEDIPFVQCSAAQRIKISVAIGLAMNPKLRVLLIREGSLLDEKNLEMVANMAEEADAQIWMERVSKGKECQVIIENGEVMALETSNV